MARLLPEGNLEDRGERLSGRSIRAREQNEGSGLTRHQAIHDARALYTIGLIESTQQVEVQIGIDATHQHTFDDPRLQLLSRSLQGAQASRASEPAQQTCCWAAT